MIRGIPAFLIVWLGQAVSLIGTGMTRFALMIWAWDQTGQATALALVGVFSAAPAILLSPLAGALVDRWNRKRVMIGSDLVAGLSTIGILLLQLNGQLDLWHIYVAAMIAGAAEAFQNPAYQASVTLMLPKNQFSRAGGLLMFAVYASDVAAPLLAGILIGIIGLNGILAIDILSFILAVVTILFAFFPQPQKSADATTETSSLWTEIRYGFRYIFVRPSLLALALVSLLFNLTESFGYPLIAPMILARTGGDETILGTVQATLGVGGVIGAIAISIWGGPKRKIHGVLIGMILTGVFGDALLGLAFGLIGWIIGGFFIEFFIPLSVAANISIWQSKVAPDVQGRVFASRRVLSQLAALIAVAFVGPLADFVFEPAMMPDGSLAPLLGNIIPPGPGAGMGLMLLVGGIFSALTGVLGYAFRLLRDIEDILPRCCGRHR